RASPVALAASHPVHLAEERSVDGALASGGAIIELAVADVEDDIVAAHPETALVVLEHLVDDVAREALPARDRGEAAIPETMESATIGAQPQGALRILLNGAHQ